MAATLNGGAAMAWMRRAMAVASATKIFGRVRQVAEFIAVGIVDGLHRIEVEHILRQQEIHGRRIAEALARMRAEISKAAACAGVGGQSATIRGAGEAAAAARTASARR